MTWPTTGRVIELPIRSSIFLAFMSLAISNTFLLVLGWYPLRHNICGIAVVLSLALDMRPYAFDRLDGCGERNDDNVIHALQCSERFYSEMVIKEGTSRTLVDMTFTCNGDDQNIAERFCLLEKNDVSGVHQVKGPVALHDPKTPTADGIHASRSFVKSDQFGGSGHFGSKRKEGIRQRRPAEFHDFHVVVLGLVNVRKLPPLQSAPQFHHLLPYRADWLITEFTDNLLG